MMNDGERAGGHTILHVSYLFLMLGGLIPMMFNGPSDFRSFGGERTGVPTMIYLAIHAVYLLMAISKYRRVLTASSSLWLPWVIVSFAAVGSFASYDPSASFQQVALLALQLVACAVIFTTADYKKTLWMLSVACLIAVMLSLLLIFVIPSYGRMSVAFPGAWQGIFIHKNNLGRFAVFSLIVFIAANDLWRGRFLFWAGLLGSATLVIGSGSATAALLAVAVVLAYPFMRLKTGVLIGLLAAIVVVPAALIALELAGVSPVGWLFETLGKSEDLTGRTSIWANSLRFIMTHPLVGYGMDGFWGVTAESEMIRSYENWQVPHAHNGLLEVGLQLGLTGMLLCAALMAQSVVRGFSLRKIGGSVGLFGVLYAIHLIGYGIGEANYLRPNSYVQVALYALVFYGATARKEASYPAPKSLLAAKAKS